MTLITVGKTTINYDQFGKGPDLVWVSGTPSLGSRWHNSQVPFFEQFRNTTFDNRGVGGTTCAAPPPWSINQLAQDTAGLIERVCSPPVSIVGHSLGGFIVTQLALDRPDLLRCAIASGTAAQGHRGWLGDHMRAEVEVRQSGGDVSGMFAVTHYAALAYPAKVLGDERKWEAIKQLLKPERLQRSDEVERATVAQLEASIAWDVADRLPTCSVPLHVFAYEEDVAAPPQDGQLVAQLAPQGEFHLFEGMGHRSLYDDKAAVVNAKIAEVVGPYL